MVFVNFRWNYSPLKKGRPELPDGLLLCSTQQSAFLKPHFAAGVPGTRGFRVLG
jgi:hypothetical protein